MIATGRPVSALRFRKSDKNGVPKVLIPMVPYLRDKQKRRCILSLTQSYRSILLPINPDLEPITAPGIKIDPSLKEKFERFVNQK